MKYITLTFIILFSFNNLIANEIPQSVKNIAICEEVYTEGIGWTHTFGEGRCPAGSNRSYGQKKYSCSSGNNQSSYECATQRLDNINNAFGAAQDALLVAGKAWADKLTKQSLERIDRHSEMIVKEEYADIVDNQKYRLTTINEPRLNSAYTAEIGDPIIIYKSGYYSDCVIPHFDIAMKKAGGWTSLTVKDAPVCKLVKYERYIKENLYYPTYLNQISKNKNASPVSYPYKVTNKKGLYKMCQTSMGLNVGCAKKKDFEDFSFKTGFVSNSKEPYKYLVYAGIYGEMLKFNLITDKGSQELFFDKSSSFIEINGSKLEVIFVDDKIITYKTLNHFDS
jgi:hypothetical protein